jgi:hypothetical protein
MIPSGEKDFATHDPYSTTPPLMSWSVKVQTRPTGAWNIAMSVLVLPGIVVLANSLYESHFGPPGHGGNPCCSTASLAWPGC